MCSCTDTPPRLRVNITFKKPTLAFITTDFLNFSSHLGGIPKPTSQGPLAVPTGFRSSLEDGRAPLAVSIALGNTDCEFVHGVWNQVLDQHAPVGHLLVVPPRQLPLLSVAHGVLSVRGHKATRHPGASLLQLITDILPSPEVMPWGGKPGNQRGGKPTFSTMLLA